MPKKNYLKINSGRYFKVKAVHTGGFLVKIEGINSKGTDAECEVRMNDYQVFELLKEVVKITKIRASQQEYILRELKKSAE